MNEPKTPLWQQLQATAAALQAVRQGQSLTAWLAALPAAQRRADACYFQPVDGHFESIEF